MNDIWFSSVHLKCNEERNHQKLTASGVRNWGGRKTGVRGYTSYCTDAAPTEI